MHTKSERTTILKVFCANVNNMADKISFIEIIGFPTTGMSSSNQKKFTQYLLSSENESLDVLVFEIDLSK